MKRLLFVTTVIKDENDGIWKKIKFNLYAYLKLGYIVDVAYRTTNGYVVEYNFGSLESYVSKVNELHKDLFFFFLAKKIDNKYDILYIRKPFGGASFIFLSCLINSIKKDNNSAKVIFEIPTYPYKNEIKILKHRISEYLFIISKELYIKKVNLIVYMGNTQDRIWNRPSLKIANGIDLNHVPLLKTELNPIMGDNFTLIGVARLSFWHGYDRIINAIANYAGSTSIRLLIVGDGEPELSRLKELVKIKNIADKVTFCGAKTGANLDELYLQSHLCIDSLGRHRSGNLYNSSLKSKEYTAKGLPFIKSHIDDSFVNCSFIYDVTANEDDINMEEIIAWYRTLPKDLPLEMRHFAETNLAWEKQCLKVLSFLQ